MVRTPRYKYMVHRWGDNNEQLYDLQNDPGEMINLDVERRYQDILQNHRNHLANWCRTTDEAYARHYSHPGHAAIPGIGWVNLRPA